MVLERGTLERQARRRREEEALPAPVPEEPLPPEEPFVGERPLAELVETPESIAARQAAVVPMAPPEPEFDPVALRRFFPERFEAPSFGVRQEDFPPFIFESLRRDLAEDTLNFVLELADLIEQVSATDLQAVADLLAAIRPDLTLEVILDARDEIAASEELVAELQAPFAAVFPELEDPEAVAEFATADPDAFVERLQQTGPTEDTRAVLRAMGMGRAEIDAFFALPLLELVAIPDLSELNQFARQRAASDWLRGTERAIAETYSDVAPDRPVIQGGASPEVLTARQENPERWEQFLDANVWANSVFREIRENPETSVAATILGMVENVFKVGGAAIRGAVLGADPGRPGTPFEQSFEDYDQLSTLERLLWESPFTLPFIIRDLFGFVRFAAGEVRAARVALAFERTPGFQALKELGLEGSKVAEEMRDLHNLYRQARAISDPVQRANAAGQANYRMWLSLNEAVEAGGLEAEFARPLRDLMLAQMRGGEAAGAAAETASAADRGVTLARRLQSFTPGGTAVPGQTQSLADIILGTVGELRPEGAPLLPIEAVIAESETLLAQAKGVDAAAPLVAEFEAKLQEAKAATGAEKSRRLIELDRIEDRLRVEVLGEERPPAVEPAAAPEPAAAEVEELFPPGKPAVLKDETPTVEVASSIRAEEAIPAIEAPAEAVSQTGAVDETVAVPEVTPPTVAPLTKGLADNIPSIREIGVVERVRPSRKVFEKMGIRRFWKTAFEAEVRLQEQRDLYEKELRAWETLVGKDVERRALIFDAMDNPRGGAFEKLTFDEKRYVQWQTQRFNQWADLLDIPPDRRIKDYITHIFEEDITRQLKAEHPLDPELIKAMDEQAPKTLFNPFLQERLGRTEGLKRDPFAAARAYGSQALRSINYEPLIQKIAVFEKLAPPNAAKFLRDFADRISNKPTNFEREANETMKQLAEKIRSLPGGEALARLIDTNDLVGRASYNFTSALYTLWLGFKPTSAIRNLSQHLLVLSETGPTHFADAIRLRFTREGKQALSESLVLRSRKRAFLPGIDDSFASKWSDKFRERALFLFREADRQNVSDAFLAGYSEAKSFFPDADRSLWISRADEVAADTQFLYTKMNSAAWGQGPIGRVFAMLTTWSINWIELMTKFAEASPSNVYLEHEAATGAKTPKKNFSQTRKALLLYLSIVGLAYLVQDRTRLKAFEYVGITSVDQLANLIGGDFPALEVPGAVADMVSGVLLDDEARLKGGWKNFSRTLTPNALRQIDDITKGEKDWMTFFAYLEGRDFNIKKLRDQWRKDWTDYDELSTAKERTQWRKDNPVEEARMFVTDRFTTLSTEKARQEALRLIEEHDIDVELIEGYDKVFGKDTVEPLDAFQKRIGNLEKLEIDEPAEYFDMGSFSAEVNGLVRQQGRSKVERDGQPLAIEYLHATDTWAPYFDYEESAARTLYRQRHPEVEASLYLWGQVSSFKNPNSVPILLDLMDKFDIPPQAVLAFQKDPSKWDEIFTPIFDLRKGTFELDKQFDNYSNPESETFIPAENVITVDGEEVNERDHTRAKLKEDNPVWVADNRRIEALEHEATTEIADAWVDRGRKVDEFSPNSPEARMAMVDDLATYRWALDEALLTDDGGLPDGDPRIAEGRVSTQWNIPALRISREWNEQDEAYDAIQDDDASKQAELRDAFLAENKDYRLARRRREAFVRGLTGDTVELYVNYYEEEAKGFRRERQLLKVPGLAEALELDKPDFVPDVKFDDLREEWEETLATFADVAEKQKGDWLLRPENKDFHLAKLEMDAFMLGFQPDLSPSYVKYYRLLAEGRPADWLEQESYHEPTWTLQENPKFFAELKRLRQADDPDWGKAIERAMMTAPSRKVYGLLVGYYDRRGIKARDNYRNTLVDGGETDLEDYLVNVLGRVPIAEKNIFEVAPDPFDEIIKELEGLLKRLR